MLVIKNVHKYFNKGKKNQIHVINDTSLTLNDNGLVALLGPSGCGKTTLLNCIGGLDKIKKGSIYINNKKISSKISSKADKIRNTNVGYIFQDYKLIDNMTVFDNVSLVLTMLGIKNKKEIKDRVEYVLDKVGMLRYKRRPASMLSGGERQRVGIARALVKNPNIILADEPTGNLDSKNSLEIMKIIKAISKDRLVILVTHEQELARFYADRIVEISDGKIINDYKNTEIDALDYALDNTFYLKDLDKDSINENKNNINIYTDDSSEPINIDIVVKKGNIYIRSNTNDKIEVVDEDSSIEMVDEHYKKIDKSDFEKYEFNLNEVIKENKKLKYSSIFNPITLITNGFKKVFDFSIIKKILLGGFVISGMFIMYAVSTIFAAIKINESDFIKYNREYLTISSDSVKVDDFLNIENREEINYIIPGDSLVELKLNYNFYYQLNNVVNSISGSLADINMLKEEDLVYGVLPSNINEIVIDQMAIESMLNSGDVSKMVGINEVSQILNLNAYVNNMSNLKIVGVSNTGSPSIYVDKSLFINILANNNDDYLDYPNIIDSKVYDYKLLVNDELYLKEGRLPENDYEVIVSINNKEAMPINKEISYTVNDHKLKVVGYYISKRNLDGYLVNNNTVKYEVIKNNRNMTISSNNKELTLRELKEEKINIKDSYLYAKENYLNNRKEYVNGVLILSGIILFISLIEIFLMIRSSFLSRVKEVGIYRAIGVKKLDIYKMFFGEILAITTLASMPGLLFMAYALNKLSTIKYLDAMFLITPGIVIIAIIFIYLFNLVIGLIPVFNTVRKKPAIILSRQDLD